MRRLALSALVALLVALATPALAFAHDQPETQQSRWIMADFIAFLAAWKAGHFQELDKIGSIPLYVDEEDYYTPEWALDEEEWEE